MQNCLKCDKDISELVDFYSLCSVITCPYCKHEMEIEYNEAWDGEEEYYSFTLINKGE